MMLKTLTGKLVLVGAIALANTVFYISSEHIFTQHIRGEASRINMAGQMRFRSFEIGWLLHRGRGGNGPLRKSVIENIEALEGIAGALKSGVSNKEEAQSLDGIINKWKGSIRPTVMEALEYPTDKGKAAIERYDSVVAGYVQEIDSFVRMLEEHFNRQIRSFDVFRVYALGLFAVLSLFIAFYIWKGVIKPINNLTDAAKEIGKGNFDAKIDVKGNDDIGLLAGTMNEMAAGLEGAITNLEGMVQQRTEELAVANEEMMAANKELQALYSQMEATAAELEEVNRRFAEANDELKGLERLKTNFLHTISHELRSPLSPILGYLEMMRDGATGEMTSKQKDILAEMHLCGRNMQLLIDELLEVASIQAGNLSLEFKDVDLYPILLDAAKEVKKYADEISSEVEVKLPPDKVILVADKKSLLGIFTHLLRNAVKFSRHGGKVTVEAFTRHNVIEVTVSDRGVGIPKDRLEKIFDVFYQVDSSATRRYEGVGLGLYLVKKLVDLHKGSIQVESKEGEGTSFSVFIPMRRKSDA